MVVVGLVGGTDHVEAIGSQDGQAVPGLAAPRKLRDHRGVACQGTC
jgi:hypothetical protein